MEALDEGLGWLPERPNGADCKSAGLRLQWFESTTAHLKPRSWTEVFLYPWPIHQRQNPTWEGVFTLPAVYLRCEKVGPAFN